MGKSRRKDKLNVSQAIRDILEEQPNATPAYIVELLAKRHRVAVTPQYVSTIKSNTKRAERIVVAPGLENLLFAKEFVEKVGGLEMAKQLLRDYELLCTPCRRSPKDDS